MSRAAGPIRVVAVAVSGGRDSMALLHCTAHAATPLGIEVVALHVHHGLQAAADAWALAVKRACARWSVACTVQRLEGKPGRGESVEAWARQGRYAALTTMARNAGASLVLLAHHRRDQAETFLLQALRGAGPAGLASMPRHSEKGGIVWARPWRDVPHEAIDAYVRRHRLRFVDDPSNRDPRFARSRLRADVMPALCKGFEAAEAMLSVAATRAAEADAILAEVAQADLAAVADGDALRLAPWRGLSIPRRRNVLRAWLRQRLGRGANETLIERLTTELPSTGPAQWPADGATLQRYRGRLKAVMAGPPVASALRSTAVAQGGIPVDALHGAQWRARSGGERFQRAPGTPPRSLKKQFQAAGVPAWQRNAPLLYSADGRLLFVPGLGIDARALAQPGEAQCALSWVRQP